MDWTNRSILITGGGSGIGLRCAKMLLDQGARVLVLDVNPPKALLARYPDPEQLICCGGDVSDPSPMDSAVDRAVKSFGSLDAAINAAGVTGVLAPIELQQDDGFDRLLAINVKGIFLAMKYEAAAMRQAKGGAIVNFGSVYAKASHENMVLYGATKHAVTGLTQGAAVEFAKHGIRVNAVAPGPILTPFIGEITPEIERAVVSGIPQQRIGNPEEVASAALWLCSHEASYVTGAVLSIDGGQSAKLSG